jgi:glycosyltransferase involved in cell wall biosynthesis
MAARLKVLMSAYACRPGKGSEHEIGWQWTLHMARIHDVTVLTRRKSREAIEKELKRLGDAHPVPTFEYHECNRLMLGLKARVSSFVRVYYVAWQRSVRRRISALVRRNHYDLLHHVTFSAYRYPTAIWGHGIPCIWGPIGGIETVPAAFMPRRSPRALLYELGRGTTNFMQESHLGGVARKASRSDLTVACTEEMHRLLRKLGVDARLMASVGMAPTRFPDRDLALRKGPLRILYVGNIIPLKGLDLGLEALSASQTDARFTLIGDGEFLAGAKRLTRKLGLSERVEFRGRLPQAATLAAYPDFDLLLFPSLHDTGGYAVLEAMANSLAVVCLAVGGPALMVNGHCGFKIPLGRRDEVVSGLASAIQTYDRDRELLRAHGKGARQVVLKDFNWDTRAEKMNEFYQEVIARQK